MTRSRSRLVSLLALSAAAALAITGCAPASQPAQSEAAAAVAAQEALESLEAEFDARLGVYAIDTGTGEEVEYRADERFAFASTYKVLAAAAVLEQNTLAELDELVAYDESDLVTYSPVTEGSVGTGMTLRQLAEAAVQYSDNTAGNLLFDELGGPAGFAAALARVGDQVTVAEREEPDLNDYVPGDDSDTSTPEALATTLSSYALGDTLSPDKRELVTQWLIGNTTGDDLIRAGVPADWVVGDKTGAAAYGTRNDIAVVWRPDGDPIVIAILSDKADPEAQYDDSLIAEATSVTIDALTE
ncbi:Beta-lactamase 1 precursor [Actinoalloteichus hoggarensis]|uniref:Beta-lactamase n=1 Tax=Actinoalloteichus hoggarensis TaxID=1470176 RepID=A0A221VY17_9PSEU|nr:class A beta-lactamase [Actinoalloteichus hoggarensis]ASO18460.1 Beta-lactamase 1 precursor [Actinoalloteichus hoggarensis]